MKNIYKLLENIGVSIPEDKKWPRLTRDHNYSLFTTHYSFRDVLCTLRQVILILEIMPYILHIIIILEHIEKLTHALEIVGI